MFNIVKRLLTSYLLMLAVSTRAEMTLDSLKSAFPDLDWDAVNQGEIADLSLGERESSDAELALVFAAKIPAPLTEVLGAMRENSPGSQNMPIDISSPDNIDASLKLWIEGIYGVTLLDWFFEPTDDGTFNVSSKELAQLQEAARAAKTKADKQPIFIAVRKILNNRVLEYLQGGMTAISPYFIDDKRIDSAKALTKSVKRLKLLKESEPDFYNAFVNFPQDTNEKIENEFFLISEMEGGRPILSLVHWLYTLRDGDALIAERKFYMSHSLDAMHTYIYLAQQGSNTIVFMGNSTLTQKVTGMGSFVAHKVGRSMVRSKIRPILESLQDDFNR